MRSCWSRRSCQAALPRSADGTRVSLASLRSWGAHFAKAAFRAGLSWSPIFPWNTWRSRGAWGPRVSVPPRYTGKAGGSWDDRAVHPEAAWLSRQSWDTRGSRGARETSWASKALQVTTEAGPLHVNESQLVMPEGRSWWPWGPLGSWGSSGPNPRIPLLTLGAHVSWGSREALWSNVTRFSVFPRVTGLPIPSGGTILPW